MTERGYAAAFGAVVMLAAIAGWPALAGTGGPDDFHGHGMMWGYGWQGWVIGPIMMIVFLAVLVALVTFAVRWTGGSHRGRGAGAPSRDAPLDILKERFARGEIDAQEFEERRRILGD
ncbi:MAG TPA: SHOCT domain-containing protein [Rhodospirillales bacterium]|jgi:putative membrane protein|nr:SHOCT domain-containing protein [Rhodospirillales bacterium]